MTIPAATALKKTGKPIRAGRASSGPTRPRTSCGCAAPCTSSTRSRASAPRSCGSTCNEKPFVNALGALTGNQAMQQVQGRARCDLPVGLAGGGRCQPRRPDVSGPVAVSRELGARRSSGASTTRCCAPTRSITPKARHDIDWLKPIVADAEAGFGGVLNAFELMKAMIEAGAAGVHFEDQLSSAKKCGHMGGKVLVPTSEAITKLAAARLAADMCSVPTVLVARTDAESANLLTSDVDERDRPFINEGAHHRRLLLRERRARCGHRARPGLCAVRRPDLVRNRRARSARGEAVRRRRSTSSFPDKLLAYNCSPSFNWKKKLDDAHDRQVPARAGRDGLQVPVHHAGGLPRAQLQHVRAGARLQGIRR